MAKRLFSSLSADALEQKAYAAFSAKDIDLLGEILEELEKHRRTHRASDLSVRVRQMCDSLKGHYVPADDGPDEFEVAYNEGYSGPRPSREFWLRAQRALAQIQAQSRGKGSVYIALLWLPDKNVHGFYVGMTTQRAENRYAQHLEGYKASKHVTRHGIGLALCLFANYRRISKQEAEQLEPVIFAALSDAGFEVSGGH